MATLLGLRKWSLDRDRDGNREYTALYLVGCPSTTGPVGALEAPGLPLPGDQWTEGGGSDPWAFCKLDAKVTPYPGANTDGPNIFFEVEVKFSSKGDDKKCKDEQLDDPLLIPDRISGGFTKYQEEATYDRFGAPITTSANEQYRGPQVEFDRSRPTIKIEQNRALLQLNTWSQMVETLNDAPLWGLPARCIKLSNASWERKFYGRCYLYYTRTFEFEVNVRIDTETTSPTFGQLVSGFDRDLLDEGTQCLRGDWNRDSTSSNYGKWEVDFYKSGSTVLPVPHVPAIASDYAQFRDWSGNTGKCILDGAGLPANPNDAGGTIQPSFNHVEYYQQSNFLILGVPTDLGTIS